MPLQRVPINNFRGGLNTRDSPFDLQPNESPDLLNVTLTALVGALQVRAGKTRFDTAGMPASPVDNMSQIVLGLSTRLMMLSINGSVYSSNSAGALTLRFTGTAGTVWSFAQFVDATGADRVWMMNGTDAPQKWDGVAASTSAWAGTPPNGNILRVWKNRMLISGVSGVQQRLYWSPFGDPELTTGPIGFLDLRGPDDEAAAITELNVLADRLYVFKNRSVWLISDPATFANRRIGQPGCSGRFQSDVLENKLYFFNEQGVWSTAGVTVDNETGSITNFFPQNLNVAAINKVRLMATRDSYPRLLFSFPIGGSTTNNCFFELIPHINFRRIGGRRYLMLPAFMRHTWNVSAMCPMKYSQWGVYAGASDANKIHQLYNGTTDEGTAISAYWKSAWIAIQGEEPLERVRRVNVELSGDAIVDIYKDFNVSPDFTATLPAAVSGDYVWDAPVQWNTGVWDPPSTYRFARLRPESRGRFHQVGFRTLAGGSPFLINVAELAIRGGKEH